MNFCSASAVSSHRFWGCDGREAQGRGCIWGGQATTRGRCGCRVVQCRVSHLPGHLSSAPALCRRLQLKHEPLHGGPLRSQVCYTLTYPSQACSLLLGSADSMWSRMGAGRKSACREGQPISRMCTISARSRTSRSSRSLPSRTSACRSASWQLTSASLTHSRTQVS